MSMLSNLLGVDIEMNPAQVRKNREQKNLDALKPSPESLVDSDIQSLLDKILSEREGLYKSTEESGGKFLEEMTGQRKQRLTDLEQLLSGSMERQFSENAPDILESLSSRGLLHSSGVGEEMAKEKGRLGSIMSERLESQSLADIDVEQKLAQDIQNRLFGIKEGDVSTSTDLWTAGLGRKYSLQDLEKNLALAEKSGQMNKESSDTESLMKLIGTIAPFFI